MSQLQPENVRFTCLSCIIAFSSPEEQRIHYRSDFHRYNIKRRTAALPPVAIDVFDGKIAERRAQIANSPWAPSTKDLFCATCNKTYTTEGSLRSHINSRKHQEKQSKVTSPSPEKPSGALCLSTHSLNPQPLLEVDPILTLKARGVLAIEESLSERAIEQSIDEKIAAARIRLSPAHCLFCPLESSSLESNLVHMSHAHSFFIPDTDYLIDLAGLIEYLGEKVTVGNVCIFCGDKGREFKGLHAVRKHMVDKSHCKIAYDSVDDRLEVSAFYDFTSSYPGANTGKINEGEDVWEDITSDTDDEKGFDEIIEVVGPHQDFGSESESGDDPADNELKHGDSHFELVLPSGKRIGHRTMRKYYTQNLSEAARARKAANADSGAKHVHRHLANNNSALVPCKGGFGRFGTGTQVIKAKNRGEAREAGRHVREFRDQKVREQYKTRIGFIANHQKHYRDSCKSIIHHVYVRELS